MQPDATDHSQQKLFYDMPRKCIVIFRIKRRSGLQLRTQFINYKRLEAKRKFLMIPLSIVLCTVHKKLL